MIKNPPAVLEAQELPVKILGMGRTAGGRHGNPLQYSCLENSMDNPWGHKESNMTEATWHSTAI